MNLELSCPSRLTVGEDLTARVRLTCPGPTEIANAEIRWVCRYTTHSRVWVFSVQTGTHLWSEVARSHQERVLSSAPLRDLTGAHGAGTTAEASVRLGALDAMASAVMIPDFGDVTSFVEVAARDSAGGEVRQRQKLWVRPRRDARADRPPPATETVGPAGSRPGPWLRLRRGGIDGPLYGEFYRPIEGTAVLAAGDRDIEPGRVSFELVCSADWAVRYLKPVRAGFKLTSLKDFVREQFQEVSMEREVTEVPTSLGALAVPAVAAGQQAEISFSWKGLKSTAQSCETPEGSISWRIDAVWTTGSHEVRSSSPVVMALPLPGSARRRTLWGRLRAKG